MIRILLLLTTISGFCQTAKDSLSECDITTIALNSEPFAAWYDTEAKDGTVVVYDGAGDAKPKGLDCNLVLSGEKKVMIKPLDFPVDINETKRTVTNPRIVLHNLEKTKAGFTVGFFYTELNWILILNYNAKGELLDYSRGAF